MIGLAGFIFSPLGKLLAIALAIGSAVVAIDRRATYRERAKCESAALRSQLDAANRDLALYARAAEMKQAELAAEEQARAEDQEAFDAKEKELVAREQNARAETERNAGAACPRPAADVCRLSRDDAGWVRQRARSGSRR